MLYQLTISDTYLNIGFDIYESGHSVRRAIRKLWIHSFDFCTLEAAECGPPGSLKIKLVIMFWNISLGLLDVYELEGFWAFVI